MAKVEPIVGRYEFASYMTRIGCVGALPLFE